MHPPRTAAATLTLWIWVLLSLAFLAFLFLLIRALLKYLKAAPARQARAGHRQNLAQNLREARMARNMTQEFVAEALGLTRQTVSKWERGLTDPSTANLLALAKLYAVPPEQLLGGNE